MVTHVQHVAVVGHVLVPDPVRRVVLEKVRQAVEGHQVIRGHHLDVPTVHRSFGEQHPDPAETVYAYSYGHSYLPSVVCYELISCPKVRKINTSCRVSTLRPAASAFSTSVFGTSDNSAGS